MSSKGKVVDNFENELRTPPKSKAGDKKAARSSAKSDPSYKSTDFSDVITLKDDTTRRIIGIFLVCFSLFSAAALLSFCFYWQTDLSVLQAEDLLGSYELKNWMGVLGANFGYAFLYKGFGLLSFAIPVYSMHYGIWLMVDKKLLNPLVWLKYFLGIGIWFIVATGSLFQNYTPVLGGGIGYYLFQNLREMTGLIGAVVLLLISAYLISWLVFGYEPFGLRDYARKLFHSKSNPLDEEYHDDGTPIYAGETLFEKDRIELSHEEEEEAKQEFSFTIADEKPSKKAAIEEEELELELTDTEAEIEDSEPPFVISKNKEPETPEHYTIDTPFDPTLELRDYQFPEIDFLNDYGGEGQKEVSIEELEKSKNMIVETLKNYNISISSIKATTGPTVTLFEIVPSAGVKISRIKNLEDDIALSLAALGIRIIAPIPGKGTIGIEVPNKNPKIVSMKSMLLSPKFQKSEMDLPVCLGKTIANEVFVSDLSRMPHLLMAGATGQGKSVGLNALLISLLYKKHPSELKFVLVDPKKVELTLFRTIERHYLAKLPGESEAIITDNKQVITTLKSLCLEMDTRYELLQDAMVRNIKEYNTKFIARRLNPNEGHRFLPYIVVIIDEVADLIMTAGKEVEHPISRLAQLARAIGIHLVLATQRPSVNIITGTIKANFPARIAFRVTSKIDSRTILDANGADQLVGRGDMLFSNGNDLIRLQCPFVDTPEVEKITGFIGSQRGFSQAYILPKVADEDGETDLDDMAPDDWDSMFEDAAKVIVSNQQGSTSLLQRKMKIGYNRAGRLIDQMEIANIVGPFKGSQAREVLVKDESSLEQILQEILKK